MKLKKKSEEKVKVIEAKPTDVGRGIARIDPLIAKGLDLESGDVIELEGKKRTAVKVWPGRPEDAGTDTIRIDGTVRSNAGVGVDDHVIIRKVNVSRAKKVKLAPTVPIRIMGGEEYLAQILEGRVITKGDLIEFSVMGRKLTFVVTSLKPSKGAVILDAETNFSLSEKPVKEEQLSVPGITYEDIGGLGEEVKKVREMIELPLRHPELFEKLGVEAPKGVLLYGPPGTGKTLLAKAVATETNAHFLTLSGPEIMSKFYGQSEENLREIFSQAEENAPSIIFIDEIDSIAPKRDEVSGEVERRVVAQLLALMDGLESRGKVIVIGATNRHNALDPAIRRPGRFDREIEIGIPDKTGRQEILQIHTRGMPLTKGVKLSKFAGLTHGYAGADIEALCKEAAMRSLRRVLPKINLETEEIPAEVLNTLEVTKDDLMCALQEMEPASMREVLIENPDIKWSDIGGLEESKKQLIEVIEWPLKYPKLFDHMNTEAPAGIMLFGPPGTGKTLLAKAVATETEANFISIKGPEFLSKWVGESEKAVRETFRKARQAAPAIIFLDEIDSIAPHRSSGGGDSKVTERVISQLLTELDGLEKLRNVVVIAATNRLDMVDTALLRPGRFDRLISIGLPDEKARHEIFKIHTAGKPVFKDVNIKKLAKESKGLNGAEIESICTEASMNAIKEYIEAGGKDKDGDIESCTIYMKHFSEAMAKLKQKGKSGKEEGSDGKVPLYK